MGVPGEYGLSTEQRKRLTIAVELVSNPSIIFMDEPTSGLDARSAAVVMRAVKNIAETGRTVVCTIHQPSIHIFEAFDEVSGFILFSLEEQKWSQRKFINVLLMFSSFLQLILMKAGGELIYSGPIGENSSEVIKYFEASILFTLSKTEGISKRIFILRVKNRILNCLCPCIDREFPEFQKSLTTTTLQHGCWKLLPHPMKHNLVLILPKSTENQLCTSECVHKIHAYFNYMREYY